MGEEETNDGSLDTKIVGFDEGTSPGDDNGVPEGLLLFPAVGARLGEMVGWFEGTADGEFDGHSRLGASDGASVGGWSVIVIKVFAI